MGQGPDSWCRPYRWFISGEAKGRMCRRIHPLFLRSTLYGEGGLSIYFFTIQIVLSSASSTNFFQDFSLVLFMSLLYHSLIFSHSARSASWLVLHHLFQSWLAAFRRVDRLSFHHLWSGGILVFVGFVSLWLFGKHLRESWHNRQGLGVMCCLG